jgi:hypothetical protein
MNEKHSSHMSYFFDDVPFTASYCKEGKNIAFRKKQKL